LMWLTATGWASLSRNLMSLMDLVLMRVVHKMLAQVVQHIFRVCLF